MIEYAINLITNKGMDGIVRHDSSIEKQVKFYNGKIEVVKEWMENSMSIFMAKNGRKMTFNIENPTRRKIKEEIEKNERILSIISPSEYHGIQTKKDYANKKKFDASVIEENSMIGIAEDAIGRGGKAGIIFSAIHESEIANSNGIFERDSNSMIYLSVRSFYRNSSAHDVSCGRRIKDIDAGVAENAFETAKEMKGRIKIKEGKYNVILYPMAFANFISHVASFSSAFYVDAGYSFLRNKIGKKVASNLLSIYDDGTASNGMASCRFDDEGNATQKTIIIEKGILKNYLHNSTTAYRYGKKTTGNAGIVAPHPWNVFVEEGNKSIDETMDEFEGIVITNVWYTRFQNYASGDFSSVARDAIFYVKKGKKVGVKKVRISDNMERILKGIKMISRERKQIFWWEVETPVFSPYAVIENVGITLP